MCDVKRPVILAIALTQHFAASGGYASDDAKSADNPKRFQLTQPRPHTTGETMTYLGGLYLVTGFFFFLTSYDEILVNASFSNYTSNLGQLTAFDNDSPNANWFIHVFSGAQCYLFYRARSYSRADAFLLTALQGALFEFTVETLMEPASVEDLINTPVAGTALGLGLEVATLAMLNNNSSFVRFFGYILNPTTLLGWHEGEVKLVPTLGSRPGLRLEIRF